MKSRIVIDACRRLNTLLSRLDELHDAFYGLTDGVNTEADDYVFPNECFFDSVMIEESSCDNFLSKVADVYYAYADHCGVDSPVYGKAKAVADALCSLYMGDMEFGPIPFIGETKGSDTGAFVDIYNTITKKIKECFWNGEAYAISATEDFEFSSIRKDIKDLISCFTLKYLFNDDCEKYIKVMAVLAASEELFS